MRLKKRNKLDSKICALTAYDYPTARILDESNVDMILVGDSLGMMVFGHEDTTNVSIEMMIHHTKACRNGVLSDDKSVMFAQLIKCVEMKFAQLIKQVEMKFAQLI